MLYINLVLRSLKLFALQYQYTQVQCQLIPHTPWRMIREIRIQNTIVRSKHTADYSLVPKLSEDDLEEKFVRGSGPGGSAVAKNSNCVVLMHVPSGIVIKCHQSRSQDVNRKLAREMLVSKLDDMINGEKSVNAQIKAMQEHKGMEQSKRKNKLREMKAQWKQREGIDK